MWEPFEAALGKAAYLGGESLCDIDLRAASWLHSCMAFDHTFGDEAHPPMEWEG